MKKKRRADWGFVPDPATEEAYMKESNSTHDPAMLKFIPKLKQRMFNK